MTLQIFLKPINCWIVGLLATAATITGVIVFYEGSWFSQVRSGESSHSVEKTPTVRKVAALGKLEPESKVVNLSGPSMLEGDNRVAQLLVKQGDQVEAGQVVAILESRDRLQAALKRVRKAVKVAKSQLAQIRAGAEAGRVAAQKAKIERLQTELKGQLATQQERIARLQAEAGNARKEYERFHFLFQEGAIAASTLDSKRLVLETTQAQLKEAITEKKRIKETLQKKLSEAKATLDQIVEVRPVNVEVAQAKVNQAVAAAQEAQAKLDQAYIRAPMAGQVLEIHTRPGETIGEQGIVELGQTEQMVVVAEVYQTDISKIHLGAQAKITSEAFSGTLHGTVNEIGDKIKRQTVFNQPGKNFDERVVEVKIRLTPQDSQQVKDLTNLQVEVAIEPSTSSIEK